MIINMKAIAVVLISSALSACGGDLTVAGNDGITGTGITAGRVTGFGSIYVNGIKFDVNNATFTRDGITSAGQSEFSVGEYVIIKGSVDKTGVAGVAKNVSFDDILEGAVTLASKDETTIEILDQLVGVDSKTKFLIDSDNLPAAIFNTLSDLAVGNIVEVSGVKDSTGQIIATSIKLKEVSGSENELKGTISELDIPDAGKLKIGSTLVDYSSATLINFNGTSLKSGQFVNIKSNTEYDGITLFASEITLEDKVLIVETGTVAEVEGIVTRFVSDTDFDLNGIPTTTNENTVYKRKSPTDTIKLDVELEVKGIVNASGVFVAEKVEFDD